MATVTDHEVRRNVDRVRAVSTTVPIGIFILIGVGSGPEIAALKANLGDGYLARFVGEPAEVADGLRELGELGIDRVQLTELVPGSHSRLAPYLL